MVAREVIIFSIFMLCVMMCSYNEVAGGWQLELDSARTVAAYLALQDRINAKKSALSGNELEDAETTLAVIQRRLVQKPYESEFRQYARAQ